MIELLQLILAVGLISWMTYMILWGIIATAVGIWDFLFSPPHDITRRGPRAKGKRIRWYK